MYAEGVFDKNNFKNSDTSVSHERLFVGPAFSGGLGGSIYHPNLLTYYLDVDGAAGWSRDSFSTSGSSSTRDEWEYLGRIRTWTFCRTSRFSVALQEFCTHFPATIFQPRDVGWRSGAAPFAIGRINFTLTILPDETAERFPVSQPFKPAGNYLRMTRWRLRRGTSGSRAARRSIIAGVVTSARMLEGSEKGMTIPSQLEITNGLVTSTDTS
jgi:hypothetical protein